MMPRALMFKKGVRILPAREASNALQNAHTFSEPNRTRDVDPDIIF